MTGRVPSAEFGSHPNSLAGEIVQFPSQDFDNNISLWTGFRFPDVRAVCQWSWIGVPVL
jgi:hypothetical protein